MKTYWKLFAMTIHMEEYEGAFAARNISAMSDYRLKVSRKLASLRTNSDGVGILVRLMPCKLLANLHIDDDEVESRDENGSEASEASKDCRSNMFCLQLSRVPIDLSDLSKRHAL